MKTLFFSNTTELFAIQTAQSVTEANISALEWLLEAQHVPEGRCKGTFVGPRREVITPWSTNATEIALNVGVAGISRIERFSMVPAGEQPVFDPMLEEVYIDLHQDSLTVEHAPEPLQYVTDLRGYNSEAGLALSDEEIEFLERASNELGRPFSDAELYAFSQINSEHCRHKIFNGSFVIDGVEQPKSLFQWIKDTSKVAPDALVSAYKDNVAFTRGPEVLHFSPERADAPSEFSTRVLSTVLSLKAETHNFPTTVEPFNGASTGSGGEIRDRMAGGRGSLPLAGTAVYMTAYPRLQGALAVEWEKHTKPRDWKYQTPAQILTKASNGASDFGNKFGQPLITGSVLTYEGKTPRGTYGYDRTVMLAGGVGFAGSEYATKDNARVGDVVVRRK